MHATTALAASNVPGHVPSDWIGWVVIIIIGFVVLRVVLRILGLGK